MMNEIIKDADVVVENEAEVVADVIDNADKIVEIGDAPELATFVAEQVADPSDSKSKELILNIVSVHKPSDTAKGIAFGAALGAGVVFGVKAVTWLVKKGIEKHKKKAEGEKKPFGVSDNKAESKSEPKKTTDD